MRCDVHHKPMTVNITSGRYECPENLDSLTECQRSRETVITDAMKADMARLGIDPEEGDHAL